MAQKRHKVKPQKPVVDSNIKGSGKLRGTLAKKLGEELVALSEAFRPPS